MSQPRPASNAPNSRMDYASTPAARYNSLSYMSARGAPPNYHQGGLSAGNRDGHAPPRGPRLPPPRLRPSAMPAWFNRFNSQSAGLRGSAAFSAPSRPSGAIPAAQTAEPIQAEAEEEHQEEQFEEAEQLVAVRSDFESIVSELQPVLAMVPPDAKARGAASASQDSIMNGMQSVTKAMNKLKALRSRAADELPGMQSSLSHLQHRLDRARAKQDAQAAALREQQELEERQAQHKAQLRLFSQQHTEQLRAAKRRRAAALASRTHPGGVTAADSGMPVTASDPATAAFDASIPASFQVRRAVQVAAARIALASEQQMDGSLSMGLRGIRKSGRTMSARGLQLTNSHESPALQKLRSICGKSSQVQEAQNSAWQKVLLQNRARAFLAALPLTRLSHCPLLREHPMAQYARSPSSVIFPELSDTSARQHVAQALLSPEAALGNNAVAKLLQRWSTSMQTVRAMQVDVESVARAAPHLSGVGLEPTLSPALWLASSWSRNAARLASAKAAVTSVLTVRTACVSGNARALAAAYCASGLQARLDMSRRETDLRRTPGLATATSDGGTGANDAEFVGLGIGEGGDLAYLGGGDAASRSTRSRIGGGGAPAVGASGSVAGAPSEIDIHARHSDVWVHQGGVSDQAAALALLAVGGLSPSWGRHLRTWRRETAGFGNGWFRELSGIEEVQAASEVVPSAERIWHLLSSTHPSLHDLVTAPNDAVFKSSLWSHASLLHEDGAHNLARRHKRQLAVSRGMPQQAYAAAMSSLAQARAQVAHAVETHWKATSTLQQTDTQIQLHGLCRIPDLLPCAADRFGCCVREGGQRRCAPAQEAAEIDDALTELHWPDPQPSLPSSSKHSTAAGSVSIQPTGRLHHEHCDVIWSDAEKIIFFAVFMSNPKRFGLIAAFLVNKSASDVISFYYKVKHAASLKARARAVASSMRRRTGPSVWEVILDAARAIGCHTPKALLGMHKNRWLDTMSISQVVSDLAYSPTRNRVSTLLARLAAQRAIHGIRLPLHIQTPAAKQRRGAAGQSPAPSPMLRLVASCTPQPTDSMQDERGHSQQDDAPASKKARL